MLSLSKRQLNYLQECVALAAQHRGRYVGDDKAVKTFDRRIQRANVVLSLVRQQQLVIADLERGDT